MAYRLYDTTEPYEATLVAWRVDCFEGYGFPHSDAMVMALRKDVDRDYVGRLLKEGATHDEAREIVL